MKSKDKKGNISRQSRRGVIVRVKTDKPFISFIVTVYNLEKYISKCLDSILNQNFVDYEIVVVDNASTDKSCEICQDYCYKYPDRVRFYQVPGEIAVRGTAHKMGFGVAHGEYVQFIDGDDRLKEDCLSEIADIINSKKTDIIMGRFECYLEDSTNNKNNFNDALFEASKINDVSYDDALVYLSTLPNFQGVIWRFIFKRSMFEKNYKLAGDLLHNAFNAESYSDGAVLIKLFLKANSIFYLDKPVYIYTRRVDGSGGGYLETKGLAKDSIISLLNVLHILISLKPQDGKYIYLMNKIYFVFKFFKFALTYIEHKQFIEIAEILEDNNELLEALKNCRIADLESFYNCIRKHGYLKGIIFYSEQIKIKFFDELKDSKNIFVFPGGNKTMSTLKLLKDNGYEVSAILDNDTKKHGHVYAGIPCMSPLVFKEYDEIQKKSITVIISALDETLVTILMRQLNELGINDTQIVVKE